MSPGLPWAWGTTAAEWERTYECDRRVPEAACRAIRGVDVEAPAATVFRWLCQLRVAPYSYDLVDNLGRRSPRTLTPGLERLEEGQPFIGGSFRLVHHVDGEELTIVTAGTLGRVAPSCAMTYAVTPVDATRSRLLGAIAADGRQARWWRGPLAWGDLVMMRRQLLTLARLASD